MGSTQMNTPRGEETLEEMLGEGVNTAYSYTIKTLPGFVCKINPAHTVTGVCKR